MQWVSSVNIQNMNVSLTLGAKPTYLPFFSITGFCPRLKSLWSCSHMNCCQHYMLHINLHILNIHFIKLNLNVKKCQESNN